MKDAVRAAWWKTAAMIAWGAIVFAAWAGWIHLHGPRINSSTLTVFAAWVAMCFVGMLLIANWDSRP